MALPKQVNVRDKVNNFQKSTTTFKKAGMSKFLTASKFSVSVM